MTWQTPTFLSATLAGIGIAMRSLGKKDPEERTKPTPRIWLIPGGFRGVPELGDENGVVQWGEVQSISASRISPRTDRVHLMIDSLYDQYFVFEGDPNFGIFVTAMEKNLDVNKGWLAEARALPFASGEAEVFRRSESS